MKQLLATFNKEISAADAALIAREFRQGKAAGSGMKGKDFSVTIPFEGRESAKRGGGMAISAAAWKAGFNRGMGKIEAAGTCLKNARFLAKRNADGKRVGDMLSLALKAF